MNDDKRLPIQPQLTERAREFRRTLTPMEARLSWSLNFLPCRKSPHRMRTCHINFAEPISYAYPLSYASLHSMLAPSTAGRQSARRPCCRYAHSETQWRYQIKYPKYQATISANGGMDSLRVGGERVSERQRRVQARQLFLSGRAARHTRYRAEWRKHADSKGRKIQHYVRFYARWHDVDYAERQRTCPPRSSSSYPPKRERR